MVESDKQTVDLGSEQASPDDQNVGQVSSPDCAEQNQEKVREINGFENKAEPTRFGDWESKGRCVDF